MSRTESSLKRLVPLIGTALKMEAQDPPQQMQATKLAGLPLVIMKLVIGVSK